MSTVPANLEKKNCSKMTILERLLSIQTELLLVQVKQKNGFHGKYMGLEELTSIILPACCSRGLTFYFTCSDTHLILQLVDVKTKEHLSPAPHIRLPELPKDMKVEGGNNTYMKRYLLMNTFLIFADIFDPDDTEDGLPPKKEDASSKKQKSNKNNVETVKSDINIPALYENALKKLREVKGLKDDEITHSAIRKQIFNDGKFTNKSERDDIMKYCKETWGASQ